MYFFPRFLWICGMTLTSAFIAYRVLLKVLCTKPEFDFRYYSICIFSFNYLGFLWLFILLPQFQLHPPFESCTNVHCTSDLSPRAVSAGCLRNISPWCFTCISKLDHAEKSSLVPRFPHLAVLFYASPCIHYLSTHHLSGNSALKSV